MRVFEVLFSIRKGLGPDYFDKNITVALDDIPTDMLEYQILDMAKSEAEQQLYNSDDYKYYGKNWIYKEIHEA